MKNFMSLKICVMASCLLLSPITNTSVVGTVAEKAAKYTLHKQLITPAGITALALMVSLFVHFSREPDFAPNRYDLEEVKSNPTAQNIVKFLYYFWLDGICGQGRKPSSLKVDADGKTIEAKPGVPPRGLFGKLADLTKPICLTLGFVAASDKFAQDGINGLLAWALLEKTV